MMYNGLHLDPFQIEAVESINRGQSVIVAAPTGCGKTVIAEYAAEKAIEQGQRLVYTAPIKALSNQKFRDFRRRFGPQKVGIHTGDVSLNPTAPLLIMTTEIFRNLILERSSRLNDVRWCVFDEIHYLDDPDRGTVWEESIILALGSIGFICLSATIPNLREVAGWMQLVRNETVTIVEELHRPVPLKHYLFSAKYGLVTTAFLRKKYRKKLSERKKFLRHRGSARAIVRMVLQKDQMPVLYFCFNRRACERNAWMHKKLQLNSPPQRRRVDELCDELVAQYGITQSEKVEELRRLWRNGHAFHHAGLLPAVKEIIERLFNEGLIKLLFCTETFALGVNMPASAVIFDELEKFNGVEFHYLMTRNYNQMAGRAGRRGIDPIGYVYSNIVPEATDPAEVKRIFSGKNEKVISRFFASYATILSLYSSFGEECFTIFRKSFRNYASGFFQQTKHYQTQEKQIRCRLAFLQKYGYLQGQKLTPRGELALRVNGYEVAAAELYYSGCFEQATAVQIILILAALITDDSRGAEGPSAMITIPRKAERVINDTRKKESACGITTLTPQLNFAHSEAVYLWANGADLSELESLRVAEGDIIRVLRMVIQLLRTLNDSITDTSVSDKMREALDLVNRDVVDAQAELEVG